MRGHQALQEELPLEKNIYYLTTALGRNGTYSYPEKVKFVFQSLFLSLPLPLLFVNALPVFFSTQQKLEKNMFQNFYYDHYFHNLIPTLALEGGIVSAEAISITTTSVILTCIIAIPTAIYQGYRYFHHRKDLDDLIELLKRHHYRGADELRLYTLTDHQKQIIRGIIEAGTLSENTVIAGKSSPLKRLLLDLIWVSGESLKYISPFMYLSLIPGLILMQRTAQNLSDDLNCGPLPLLAIYFELCSPIKRVELMSLLAYSWGCFSGTYLVLYSFTLFSRLALIPFPGLRHWFHKNINKPFAEWSQQNQYEQLFKKVLLAFFMPPAAAYSLYRCLQFTHAYLEETGCTATEAFSRGFFSGPPYPCSTTQASLGVSVFIGAFEFEHLYPIYMLITATAHILACSLRQQHGFDAPFVIAAVEDILDRMSVFENKLLLGTVIGVILGGTFGLWPALQMSYTILRKEGVEIFFPLKNLSTPLNTSLPDLFPAQDLPFDVNDLMNHLPECTVSAEVGLPPLDLGNHTFPGMNISVPCIEILFDAATNQTVLGLQITPPCPDLSPLSVYGANLFHVPLQCDSILLVRTMAGFVAPYWLSVNTGGALGLTLALILVSFSCLKSLCQWTERPAARPSTPDPVSDSSDLELVRLIQTERPEREEKEIPQNEELSYCARLKRRVCHFFPTPNSAESKRADDPAQKPLLRPTLSPTNLELV